MAEKGRSHPGGGLATDASHGTARPYCVAVPESPSSWDRAAGTRLWIRPDERVLWRGGPDPEVTFGPEDKFLIPLSLMWGGFAAFWEIGVSEVGSGLGSIVGIPLVVIGLYLIFGRFAYKRWTRRHTRYAISDQRIIVTRHAGRHVQSMARVDPFQITRRRGGIHATLLWQVPGWQPTARRRPYVGASTSLGPHWRDSGWPVAMSQRRGIVGFYDVTRVDQALAALHGVRS